MSVYTVSEQIFHVSEVPWMKDLDGVHIIQKDDGRITKRALSARHNPHIRQAFCHVVAHHIADEALQLVWDGRLMGLSNRVKDGINHDCRRILAIADFAELVFGMQANSLHALRSYKIPTAMQEERYENMLEDIINVVEGHVKNIQFLLQCSSNDLALKATIGYFLSVKSPFEKQIFQTNLLQCLCYHDRSGTSPVSGKKDRKTVFAWQIQDMVGFTDKGMKRFASVLKPLITQKRQIEKSAENADNRNPTNSVKRIKSHRLNEWRWDMESGGYKPF